LLRLYAVFLTISLLVGCSDSGLLLPKDAQSDQVKLPSERWYSMQQVEYGLTIFEENCSDCHGVQAGGKVANWKQKLQDGSFPPPPLDGSAHAWHHPRSVLLGVINDGGFAYGGKMPAFKDVLKKEEKLAAIAYFQDFWDDETYHQWEVMGGAR